MPDPRPFLHLPLVLALAVALSASAVPSSLLASEVPEALAQQLEQEARSFWSSFCHEDLPGMSALADQVVMDDLKKGFWVRDHLEKIHHQAPREGAATAAVPVLAFTQVKESSLLCMQAVIRSVDVYQLTFTAPEMSGTICIARDSARKVMAFTGP